MSEIPYLYSWEAFTRDADLIAHTLRKKFARKHFDGIYGIPRGGLVLAVTLSHRMKLPMLLAPTKHSLVVDDIADTGETLRHYREIGAAIVTLFYHRQSIVIPDVWIREKKKKWIHYPWEA